MAETTSNLRWLVYQSWGSLCKLAGNSSCRKLGCLLDILRRSNSGRSHCFWREKKEPGVRELSNEYVFVQMIAGDDLLGEFEFL